MALPLAAAAACCFPQKGVVVRQRGISLGQSNSWRPDFAGLAPARDKMPSLRICLEKVSKQKSCQPVSVCSLLWPGSGYYCTVLKMNFHVPLHTPPPDTCFSPDYCSFLWQLETLLPFVLCIRKSPGGTPGWSINEWQPVALNYLQLCPKQVSVMQLWLKVKLLFNKLLIPQGWGWMFFTPPAPLLLPAFNWWGKSWGLTLPQGWSTYQMREVHIPRNTGRIEGSFPSSRGLTLFSQPLRLCFSTFSFP